MDKLVFKVPRPIKPRKDSAVIRVTGDAYSAVDELSAKTGFSAGYIASQLILFGAEHVEVIFEENDEEEE